MEEQYQYINDSSSSDNYDEVNQFGIYGEVEQTNTTVRNVKDVG